MNMRSTALQALFLVIACLLFAGVSLGQDGEPPPAEAHDAGPRPDTRGDLLRQLGLSPDQIQKIRRMNIESRPLMQEAQRRVREATVALNAAIYADEVNETEFQTRLKDLQLAQAEVQRLRFRNEFAVRRILTPDQLVRFRDLRERFEQARQNAADRREMRQNMRRMDSRPPAADTRPTPPPTRVVKQDQQKQVQ